MSHFVCMKTIRGWFQLSYALLAICYWIAPANGRRPVHVTVKENESFKFSDSDEGSDIESIQYSDKTICKTHNGTAKIMYLPCENDARDFDFSIKRCNDVTFPKVKPCHGGLYGLVLWHNKSSPWQRNLNLTMIITSSNSTGVDENETSSSRPTIVAVVCVVSFIVAAAAAISYFVYKRKMCCKRRNEEQNQSATESRITQRTELSLLQSITHIEGCENMEDQSMNGSATANKLTQ